MTAQPPRPADEGVATGMSRVSNIIAVSSCKGGVGKSTTAVNLAFALHRQGARVGILDADIHGPSLPTMVRPETREVEFEGNQIKPLEARGVKLMSYGFVNPGAAAIMRGPMVVQLLQQFVGLTSWGELDYLVIDMPPGTGDIQLTLCQVLNITAAVVVTTPQRLSFTDVVKGIDMFDVVNVPSVAVVENMAYYEEETDEETDETAETDGTAKFSASGLPDADVLVARVKEVFGLRGDELRERAFGTLPGADSFNLSESTNPVVLQENSLRELLVTRAVQEAMSEAVAAAVAAKAAAKAAAGPLKRRYLFGRGHSARLADMWGIENTVQMPLAADIARLGDSGVPVVVAAPDGPHAAAYGALATAVVQEVAKLRHGGSGRPQLRYDEAEHAIVVEVAAPSGVAAAAAAVEGGETATGSAVVAPAAGVASTAGAGDAAGAAAATPPSRGLRLLQAVRPAALRRACRCAVCVEELTGRPLLRPEDVSDDVKPTDFAPVGNYAVAIGWSDGHRSLYPYAAFIDEYGGRRRRARGLDDEELAGRPAAAAAADLQTQPRTERQSEPAPV
ncbi:unnamed protein product [Phaeothamnion confervicola]